MTDSNSRTATNRNRKRGELRLGKQFATSVFSFFHGPVRKNQSIKH